jgi:D-alanyl-D-alanine carboxypeptidase/D-alanyl-D-alanine-endopeptidase (penicillin-binding protein 4)
MPRLILAPAPRRRRLLGAAVLAAFAVSLYAPAQAKKPPRKSADAEITDLSDEGLSQRLQIPLSAVGYLVVDAKTGQVIEQRNVKEPFVPASTIKVASTLAALLVLGADHRFATEVYTTGTVEGGALAGDLYLKGGGDPMLTSDDFEAIAQQLKAKGITRVAGRFIYDSSAYATARAIDRDYEESASYNPGIAALSVNFNVLQLKWQREKKGEPRYRFAAQTDHAELDVDYLKAVPGKPGETGPYGLAYREEEGRPLWIVVPSKRPKGEIRVPVKQPDFNAAYIFRKAAEKHGVALPVPAAGALPAGATLAVRHLSKPLPEIVYRTQRFSNNMAAELLSLAAARKLTGKAVDIAGAAGVLGGWLKETVKGADWAGLDLRNGSGLTKDSRITPEQMVAILRHAQSAAVGDRRYADLLRTYFVAKGKGKGNDSDDDYGSGENGKPAAKDKIGAKAKTGTVNYSRGLVGYLHTARGRDLVFAIFISDYKQREVMRKQGQAYKEPAARWWASRSREFQRAAVRRWAERL